MLDTALGGPEAERLFSEHRGLLRAVAYRVLGSVTDAEDVALADSVSTGMLLVLETLSPIERAVFVLREAFGHSHAEARVERDLLARATPDPRVQALLALPGIGKLTASEAGRRDRRHQPP